MPKITIDLLGATADQRSQFDKQNLPATLDTIRRAVGDPCAEVVITWLNRGPAAEHHVVQTLDNFPPAVAAEFARSGEFHVLAPFATEPSNTWTPKQS